MGPGVIKSGHAAHFGLLPPSFYHRKDLTCKSFLPPRSPWKTHRVRDPPITVTVSLWLICSSAFLPGFTKFLRESVAAGPIFSHFRKYTWKPRGLRPVFGVSRKKETGSGSQVPETPGFYEAAKVSFFVFAPFSVCLGLRKYVLTPTKSRRTRFFDKDVSLKNVDPETSTDQLSNWGVLPPG